MLIGWIVVVALFGIGIAGAFIPVLPGALAIFAAFFAYGLLISFQPLGFWFWLIQSALLVTLLVADYAVGALGVQRFGGSRASVVGSTIGIIAGPFVIPAFGLLLGPFLGALLGELLAGADWYRAFQAGIGAVVGFFSSAAVKLLLQLIMIALFFIWVI